MSNMILDHEIFEEKDESKRKALVGDLLLPSSCSPCPRQGAYNKRYSKGKNTLNYALSQLFDEFIA